MKKLQVFVSSTYEDLKEERQAAVQAILGAGHIPAGMELFTAGDEAQWTVIKRWIEESDVFVLILGCRYGSVAPGSNRSYVEREFDFAVKLRKPLFSIVISDDEMRKKQSGTDIHPRYKAFREKVLGKLCNFFVDGKDIELSIHKTMRSFTEDERTVGWFSGREHLDTTSLVEKVEALREENDKLTKELEPYKNDETQRKRMEFSSTDYVRHLNEKHGIEVEVCMTGFRQANSIGHLAEFLNTVAPRETNCEFFREEFMVYEFLGMINRARMCLGLTPFDRHGEASHRLVDTYVGVPIHDKEPGHVTGSLAVRSDPAEPRPRARKRTK